MTHKPGLVRKLSKAITSNRSRSSSTSSTSSLPAGADTETPQTNVLEDKILSKLGEVTHGDRKDDDETQRTDKHTSAFNAGPGVSNEDRQKRTRDSQLDEVPANPSSRWYLHARALTLRHLASLGFALQNRSYPPAPAPTRSIWIDSKLSKWSGKRKIGLDVWTPTSPPKDGTGRVGVVSLHGGGFILGYGTDDSRWAGALMDQLDAVVIAINYRCAPGHPFPTAVEDCADGILHIRDNAQEYGIDPDKLIISGFSAGGNLAFSSYFLLQRATEYGYPNINIPRIRGIVGFYPLLDFSISRSEKRENCVKPECALPDSLTSVFDQSYLHPEPDRTDPLVSPAQARDDLLNTLPDVHLCCCQWDMLYAEAERFKDRLEVLREGRKVGWRVVAEEKHGWDKPPPMTVKPSVGEEYTAAIESIKTWLGVKASETSADEVEGQDIDVRRA